MTQLYQLKNEEGKIEVAHKRKYCVWMKLAQD